jgi:hypothetical protein
MPTANSSTKRSPISARERARQATTRRLAAEQIRLKNNEDDLVAFFDAGRTAEKVAGDVEKKIQAIRNDAATKIDAAEREQAVALRTMKDRGETVASIAEATELSATEVRKLLKLATASTPQAVAPQDGDPSTTGTGDESEELPPAAIAS